MSQYFPKPYERFSGNINVKVDFSNYATKDDIKNITHVDTSSFGMKMNLANLKTEVDKLDIDKLVPVPADLRKLSNVVNNEVVKKTEYDKLVTKVNNINIGTGKFILKSDYDADKTKLENKIPNISKLATKAALNAIENKIPDVSNLVKKSDYGTKIKDIENKYITTTEFNKLASDAVNARIVQANLVKKTDFDNKIIPLAKEFSYFHGKNYFDEDGNQNYYIFQPISKYLKVANVNDINYILSWKSRELSDMKIESIKTSNYSLNQRIATCHMSKIKIKFDGSFSHRFPPTVIYGNIVNIYIVYEITSDYKDINYPTLENCLFGSVKLTKNSDIDKNRYSGYGIGFDRETSFLFGNEVGKNVIIFGVDMNSSSKINNRKKDILILGKGPTQGLEHTLNAEKLYSVNFTKKIQNFV